MRTSFTYLLAITIAVTAVGCKSTKNRPSRVQSYNWASLDAQLADGSNATPRHNLSQYEYPFDANGRYVASWAAEGERRSGRNAYTKPKRSTRSRSSSTRSKPKAKIRRHTVRAGDTLWALSQRYGTSVSAIKRVNGLSSNTIVNGRTLRIP